VIVLVDGPRGVIRIEEAPLEPADSHICSEIFTHSTPTGQKDLKNVSVVSAGKGSDHSRIGCLNFSWYDPKRKAARG
jgi:aldehyde:ferredoxin oxidoreductase